MPLPRLGRLRRDLVDARYGLCTQKAELLTEAFRRRERVPAALRTLSRLHFAATRRALSRSLGRGVPQRPLQLRVSRALQRLYAALERRDDPPPLAYAHGLAHVLEHASLRVYPHELIVGNLSSHRIGAPLHPDFGGLLLLPELATLDQRRTNALRIDPRQRERLEREVLPFWFSRSVLARAPLLAGEPALANTLVRGQRFVLTQFAGISHVTPDYPAVLEHGFEGLALRAEAARSRARSGAEADFAEAAGVVAHAAVAFGARWSAHCAAEAQRERDPARAAELRTLAAILAQVPARPARSFHEALQSVFLAHVMVHQESFQHGVSFGRVDQYLRGYYERDLAEGRLTREHAVELVGCFLGKAAEQVPLFNTMATEYFSGLSSASGLTLGGTDAEGNDATGPLSFVFLDAYDQMRLRQPNLHLRVHTGTPDALLERACELIREGGGMPALFSDEAIVPALRALEIPEVDARDYAIVGCVEWGVPRRSFPAAGAGFLSLPAALDAALRRDPAGEPTTMNELFAAFGRELARTIDEAVAGNDAIERAHALHRPTPLLSLLVDGCLDTLRDVTAGGAVYDSSGLQGVGLADVADSLAAAERFVFQERRLSLAELIEAVRTNFTGRHDLRARILHKLPRYGEDDGRAEHWAREVARLFCRLVRQHHNPRGGPYAPGLWCMTTHVGFGSRLGALPSGRCAGAPLADGISPANGWDRRGPTASLLAAAHVGGPHVANGLALNEKLDPTLVRGEPGLRRMIQLVRGYFAGGGMQLQLNVLDAHVLIDAKLHPERHRDLVVRVSGYSAYFNDLTDAMKDDTIAPTLHDAGAPACQPPAGAATGAGPCSGVTP